MLSLLDFMFSLKSATLTRCGENVNGCKRVFHTFAMYSKTKKQLIT